MRWTVIACLLCIISIGSGLAQESVPEPSGPEDAVLRRLEKLEERLRSLEAENQQLREEIRGLREATIQAAQEKKEKASEESIRALREAARAAAESAAAEETAPRGEETVFRSGTIGLQALNPEISLVGDFLARYVRSGGENFAEHDDGTDHSGFFFRTLGLHFQSYLDPYSLFKGAVEFHEGGETELGEAYVTWFGLRPGLNLTLGKFRQQFGIVNRWHMHGLDQVNYPLPLQEILGPEGLNQSGISLEWNPGAAFGGSQEVIFQLTNASNDRLFSGNEFSEPAYLLRYRNFRDLTKDIYLQLGISGLAGTNDRWPVEQPDGASIEVHDTLWTTVLGLDLTYLWEPTDRMRYRNFLWRTEFYYGNRDLVAPDGSGEDTLDSWGVYTELQSKLTRTLEAGVRLDYFEPDDASYAEPGFSAGTNSPWAWQACPYLTWWQSPFVRLRLEYDYLGGQEKSFPDEHLIMLQTIVAAGPHKHERY